MSVHTLNGTVPVNGSMEDNSVINRTSVDPI